MPIKGERVESSGTPKRMRCCICGDDTGEAEDYLLIRITPETGPTFQYFGVHASHLQEVLARGFNIEIP
jgi:hypothetical protein